MEGAERAADAEDPADAELQVVSDVADLERMISTPAVEEKAESAAVSEENVTLPTQHTASRHKRLRVFANGDPRILGDTAGRRTGSLCLVREDMEWVDAKQLFVELVWSREVAQQAGKAAIRVFLLPDGEELLDMDYLREDDRVAVSIADDFKVPERTRTLLETSSEQGRRGSFSHIPEDRPAGARYNAGAGRVPQARLRRPSNTKISRPRFDPDDADSDSEASGGGNVVVRTVKSMRDLKISSRRRMSKLFERPNGSDENDEDGEGLAKLDDADSSMVRPASATVEGDQAPPTTSASGKARFKRLGTKVRIANAVGKRFGVKGSRTLSEGDGGAEAAKKAERQSLDQYIEDICNIYKYDKRRPVGSDGAAPHFVIFPEDPRLLCWNLIIIILVVYYAFALPIQLCFMDPHPTWRKPIVWRTAFDITADFIFIADVWVNFHLAFKDRVAQEYIVDLKRIRDEYLKMWFWIDAVATIPFEWTEYFARLNEDPEVVANISYDDLNNGIVAQSASNAVVLLGLLRLLKIFKLLRAFRLIRLLSNTGIATVIQFNPSASRFFGAITLLLVIWHFIGCIYWYFAAYTVYAGIGLCGGNDCIYANGDSRGYYVCSDEASRFVGTAVPGDVCIFNEDAEYRCGSWSEGMYNKENDDDGVFCFNMMCKFTGTCDFFQNDVRFPSGEIVQYRIDKDSLHFQQFDLFPDHWLPHPEMANEALTEQYFQAMFWAVEVTTGIGDDIIPNSTPEILVTILFTILGLVSYSFIISTASSALVNHDSLMRERQQLMEKVQSYLSYRSVPKFFQDIITDYYAHVWENPADDSEFLGDLPETLRLRLSLLCNRDLVDKIPLFAKLDAEEFVQLVPLLRLMTFLPGEFIVKHGGAGDAMYYIKRGSQYSRRVDVLAPLKKDHAKEKAKRDSEATGKRKRSYLSKLRGGSGKDLTKVTPTNEAPAADEENANDEDGVEEVPNTMTLVATLKFGSFFGENALITGGVRNASCRAVNFVDCLVLSKVDFDSVIRKSETVFNKLREHAEATSAQTARAVESELVRHAKKQAAGDSAPQKSPSSIAGKVRQTVVDKALSTKNIIHPVLSGALSPRSASRNSNDS